MCSFRRIQKRIFDSRFARVRGRKEREIRNWICNLGNLSPTRAICTTASQKMTCFLLFDKLCDYTVQNLVVGSSNSDDGTYKTDKERSALKLKFFTLIFNSVTRLFCNSWLVCLLRFLLTNAPLVKVIGNPISDGLVFKNEFTHLPLLEA